MTEAVHARLVIPQVRDGWREEGFQFGAGAVGRQTTDDGAPI